MRVTAPETLPLKNLQTTDMMRPLYVPAILVAISPPPYSTFLAGLSHPPTHSTHTLSHLTASAVLSSCLPTYLRGDGSIPFFLPRALGLYSTSTPGPSLGGSGWAMRLYLRGDWRRHRASEASRMRLMLCTYAPLRFCRTRDKPKDEPQGSARLGHVGYFPRVVRNVVFQGLGVHPPFPSFRKKGRHNTRLLHTYWYVLCSI